MGQRGEQLQSQVGKAIVDVQVEATLITLLYKQLLVGWRGGKGVEGREEGLQKQLHQIIIIRSSSKEEGKGRKGGRSVGGKAVEQATVVPGEATHSVH